jgi:hypothetical protein
VQKNKDTLVIYDCIDGTDTLNSTVKVYYKSKLYSVYNLINGKIHGISHDYHENGKIHIQTHFKNGYAHGMNMVYNRNGILLRESLYIENKLVLFRSYMIDTVYNLHRERLTSFVGEEPFFAGEIIKNSEDSIITGVYSNLTIPDTLLLHVKEKLNVQLYLPKVNSNNIMEVLIGKFDSNLNCKDTIYYISEKKTQAELNFEFLPQKIGYDFLLGYVQIPNKEKIYFFDDFYTTE